MLFKVAQQMSESRADFNLNIYKIIQSFYLPTEIEKIVAEKISSGAYQSADKVISVDVRLLEAKEKGTKALRREIMCGFEDIREGRYTILSSDEELETFSDDIIPAGEKT